MANSLLIEDRSAHELTAWCAGFSLFLADEFGRSEVVEDEMRKFAVILPLILGTAAVAMAGGPPPVPEIDPTTGAAALALVAGAVLIIRGRRKA